MRYVQQARTLEKGRRRVQRPPLDITPRGDLRKLVSVLQARIHWQVLGAALLVDRVNFRIPDLIHAWRVRRHR